MCWELDVPANFLLSTTSDFATTLTLQDWRQNHFGEDQPTSAQLDAEKSGDGRPMRITLALFTDGASKLVSGEIGPGRVLEIELLRFCS